MVTSGTHERDSSYGISSKQVILSPGESAKLVMTLVTATMVLFRCSAIGVAVKAGLLLIKMGIRRHWNAHICEI
ncbi:hypothetical protein TNCV_940331 [Trichonephila clavipes]|nr:hypothetical protein TNCV_940331 [Trichonephila clavipes]